MEFKYVLAVCAAVIVVLACAGIYVARFVARDRMKPDAEEWLAKNFDSNA